MKVVLLILLIVACAFNNVHSANIRRSAESMEELLSNGLNVFPKFDPSKHDSPMERIRERSTKGPMENVIKERKLKGPTEKKIRGRRPKEPTERDIRERRPKGPTERRMRDRRSCDIQTCLHTRE